VNYVENLNLKTYGDKVFENPNYPFMMWDHHGDFLRNMFGITLGAIRIYEHCASGEVYEVVLEDEDEYIILKD